MPSIRVLVSALAVTALTFSSIAAHAADYVIKIAHSVTPTAPVHKALLQFKKDVETATDKRVEIRVFHSGQLGGQRETIEAAQAGAIEMVAAPNGVLASFAPDFQLVDIPFQFDTLAQARGFMDQTGEKILFPSLEKANLVGMAIWEQGFRNLGSTKKPVIGLADMKSMHIRTMEAPLHIEAWRSMGANPTPMGWGQVYTAMEQGLLEAVENPSYVFTQSKISETIKYFTVTQHIYDPIIIVGSKKFFDTMPADLRTTVIAKLKALTSFERQLAESDVVEAEKIMEKKGIKLTRLDAAQRGVLAAASQPPVVATLKKSLGETRVTVWQSAVRKQDTK